MPRDHIMKALKNILAHKDLIQKVRDLNFDKELQVKYEINRLKTRRNEELEHIILKNRYLGRLDSDGEEKIIDEIEKSIREEENELKNLFATDNDLIDSLLKLDEFIKNLKTALKIDWLFAMYNNARDKYSRFRIM